MSNGKASVPGGWRSCSLAVAVDPEALDLRRPEDALALGRLLEGIDLVGLWEKLGEGAN
jgi:hypothetical protein